MGTGLSTATKSGNTTRDLSEEVTSLSDTIRACDRLCLLSARTVVRAARPLAGKTGPLSFIPSITRDLDSAGDNYEGYGGRLPPFLDALHRSPRDGTAQTLAVRWYPTTSAACIAALQVLNPVVGRFRIGTRENKDLAFHPIERDALDAFDPKRLPNETRSAIEGGLKTLNKSELNKIRETPEDLTDSDLAQTCLFSTTFGGMHPFTASQILRVAAPSSELFRHSLFIVLWFLNRRGSSSRGHPNIQSTSSPGTAVMTSKCVDAVEGVYKVFGRRWNRFQRLIRLTAQLRGVQSTRQQLEGVRIADKYTKGYSYKETVLIKHIRAIVNDIAKDTGVQPHPSVPTASLGSDVFGLGVSLPTCRPVPTPAEKPGRCRRVSTGDIERIFRQA